MYEKFDGLNFHMRIIAKIKRNWTVFETAHRSGNKKWITYDNNIQKKLVKVIGEAPQTVAKSWLTPRKVMLRVWWDWKVIVHYELLPSDQTIDSNLYCQQLEKLRQAIERKRPKLINKENVVFHGQCQIWHIFGNPSKIERTELESFNASIL